MKKSLIFLMSLCMIMNLSVFNTSYAAAVNLAEGKTAIVSDYSTHASFPASNLTDGDPTTRWAATSSNNGRIIIDFGTSTTVNCIKMLEFCYPATARRITGFNIEYSNDMQTWTNCYTGTVVGDSAGEWGTYYFEEKTARYFCINVTAKNSSMTMYEIEAYYDPVTMPTIEVTAPGAEVEFLTGETITVSANVTQGSNAISTVEFLCPQAASIGNVTQSGNVYSAGLVFNDSGSYDVEIKVTDSVGITKSETKMVYVNSRIISRNFAHGKTATVIGNCDSHPDYGPAKAVDGDASTRWSATRNSSGTFYVDLGVAKSVNAVKIKEFIVSNQYRTTEYKIVYSNNETQWTDLCNGTTIGSTPGADTFIDFDTVEARYIGINFISSSNTPSIYEFGVYKKNVVPSITVVSPSTEVQYDAGDNIEGSVEVADTDGSVSSVSVLFDNVAQTVTRTSNTDTYTFTLSQVTPGSHTLKVIATDDAGESKESTVTFQAYPYKIAFDAITAPGNTTSDILAALGTYSNEYELFGMDMDSFNALTSNTAKEHVAAFLAPYLPGLTYTQDGKDSMSDAFALALVLSNIRMAGSDTALLDSIISQNGNDLGLSVIRQGIYSSLEDLKAPACQYILDNNSFTDLAGFHNLFIDAQLLTASRLGTYRQIDSMIAEYGAEIGIDVQAYRSLNNRRYDIAKALVGSSCASRGAFVTVYGDKYDEVAATITGDTTEDGQYGSVNLYPLPEMDDATADDIWTKPLFDDLSRSHWAYDAISVLYEKDIMVGDGAGNVHPDAYILRQEFTVMTVKLFDLPSKESEISFSDVNVTDWYNSAVETAAAHGLIYGYEDGSFGIGKVVLRQDAAVIIYRTLKGLGLIEEDVDSSNFRDEYAIDEYAKVAVCTLQDLGILSGDEHSKFNPKKQITRSETAAMYKKVLEMEGINE